LVWLKNQFSEEYESQQNNIMNYDSLDQTDISTNDITILPEQDLYAKKQLKKDKKKLFHKFTN
jgi:hypothetical protein